MNICGIITMRGDKKNSDFKARYQKTLQYFFDLISYVYKLEL